jgi:outer membrane immunogenic protein
MVQPLVSWAGFYIGGQVGGAWSHSDYTLENVVGLENFTHEPSALIGGGHIGLQGQWGNWVLGVEGTYSWTDLDSTLTSVLQPGRRRTLTIDSIGTVVGKAGMAFNNWLFYVKGGWAITNIDTFAINPATGVNGRTSGTESGWTVGTGIDYMLNANWIIGVDFNYYRFDFDRSGIFTDATAFRYFNTNSDIYSVMGRVSYKF